MMAPFILGLFVVVGIVVIAFPLFRPHQEEIDASLQDDELETLNFQKESYYSAIKELEFDFKAKKLSRKDYEGLRDEYKNLALDTISQIDKLERGKVQKEDWIEEEVKKIKKKRSKKAQ